MQLFRILRAIVIISIIIIPTCVFAATKINLFTSIPQNIIDAIKDDFTKKHPDVILEIFRSDATGVESRIEVELASPVGLSADVIWVTDPAYLIDLKRRSVLLKYKSPEDANLLIGKDPDGYYYGARLMTMVIAYNSDKVVGENVPMSWKDLSKPYFSGRLIIPDPLSSGTSLTALAALSDKFSLEYFEMLFKNNVSVVPKNGTVIDNILEGKSFAGIALDYMVREKKMTGEPIALIYPDDGFVVVPSPIAIIGTSKAKSAAMEFMDYVLSKDGQEQIVKIGNFLPVRSDVFPPEDAPTIERVLADQIPINWDDLNKNKIRIKGRYFDLMTQYLYYNEETQ